MLVRRVFPELVQDARFGTDDDGSGTGFAREFQNRRGRADKIGQGQHVGAAFRVGGKRRFRKFLFERDYFLWRQSLMDGAASFPSQAMTSRPVTEDV